MLTHRVVLAGEMSESSLRISIVGQLGRCGWGPSVAPGMDAANNLADNTNADIETRGHWIQLARKAGVPIRCMYFTAPTKLCEHNDTVRALNGGTWNPEKRQILPHSAFSAYAARFGEPKLNEGFQDTVRVPFQVRT